MSKPMSFSDFSHIVQIIRMDNAPFRNKPGLPVVKYIDPHFDMRFNTIFAVTFRLMNGPEQTFHTQNEYRDAEESLYDRIRRFLDTPMGEFKDCPPSPSWPGVPKGDPAKEGMML